MQYFGKMPAGTYYVGDLCYVLSDRWDKLLDITDLKRNRHFEDGQYELEPGVLFAWYSTMYGDGGYRDQFGKMYCVDSGTIGCVEVKHIADREELGSILKAGHAVVFDFPEPFDTGAVNGKLTFGFVTIDTGDSEEGD